MSNNEIKIISQQQKQQNPLMNKLHKLHYNYLVFDNIMTLQQFIWKGMRCAVILSGAGGQDGTEITEATALNINLHQYRNNNVSYFAPNTDQYHVINHLNGESILQKRNVLEESARLVRGNIHDLKQLDATNFDTLLFPGGFGAAKNLSTFAIDGANMKVNQEVERVIRDFHKYKKPIGACCIAPIILAKVLGKKAKITLGMKSGDGWPYVDCIKTAESFGSQVIEKTVEQICIDYRNFLVTTPAYMYEQATPLQIYQSIEKMLLNVNMLLRRFSN